MDVWIAILIADIKKGSIVQFLITVLLVVGVTGYEVSRTLRPITSTAILYWEGGITTEEIERSSFHELCEGLNTWPISIFVGKNPTLDDKCATLKNRHMLRTAADWREYQTRAMTLLQKGKGSNVPGTPTGPSPLPPPPTQIPGALNRTQGDPKNPIQSSNVVE